MPIPLTTEAPIEAGDTSVIKDLDGNLLVKKGDLPTMTIRPGTIAPQTWAMLSAKAAPSTTPADIGIVPTTPGMPPGVPLPAPTPVKYGPPTSDAGTNPTPQVPPPFQPTAPAPTAMNPLNLIGSSPKLMAQQEKAFADQKGATTEQAQLAAQRSDEEAQARRMAEAKIARDEAAAQTQRDYLANRMELEERARNKAVDEAAAMKVDPGRLMSSKSAGERVLLGIAAFFGGFGAAVNHTANFALESIERDIDRDIDAQKTAIMNAKDNVSVRNNLVAQMRTKIGDFDQSALAAKQVTLERLKRQTDALASEYGGPEAAARAKAFNAGLDEKLAELKIQQDNVAKGRAVMLLDKMPVPGGKPLNEGTAKELGEATGAVTSAQDLLSRFNGNADGVGGWLMSFLPMTDASKYEDRAKVAAQTIGSYLEGGKLTDPDYNRYRSMLPKPGDAKTTARNKIDAIVKLLGTRQASQKGALAASGYNVRGIKDAAPTINFTPTGR